MRNTIVQYKRELEKELTDILDFWIRNTIDNDNKGFYGKIDNENNVYKEAAKGSVLNSRILWSFSAAYNLTKNINYLHIAERAFEYIKNYFIDREFGGVYWSVDYKGRPLDTKKQIYALSFAVYGLSEYYCCSKNKEAQILAIELYKTIVEYSYDNIKGGYFEAFTRDWKDIDNMRLSSKDANEKKSMNTHLHVLEGFANLYLFWPDKGLLEKTTELITIFFDRIIDKETNHLMLFFDEEWRSKSTLVSYGHDIEAAWLIQEAAEIINNAALLKEAKLQALKIANAASEGLDKDGGLWYEYEANDNHLIKEKHSWPQAESMVGFFNAWQITGDETYLDKSLNSWRF
ncbi:MAG: AGE family epimerase/isomerase, partial [Ginsengibacter sp.]